MAEVIIRNLAKRFGAVEAVKNISLRVGDRKFVTLLGPSGCGKTTVLRCIAGVEVPDKGEITIGGDMVFSSASKVYVPPEKRGIGMVYQSYALWPHLSVFDNVAYTLKIRRVSRTEVRKRVKEALEMVKLSGLEDRPAPNLSGGQQQRVALARALVYNPRLILFDEPLSNLDAPLREEMRSELKQLQRNVGVTAVYVTHDRSEALSLSDELVIMENGTVRAIGSPMELLAKPPNSYSAVLLAGMTVLDGQVIEVSSNSRMTLSTPIGKIECKYGLEAKEGERTRLCLRVDGLKLSKSPGKDKNVFSGTVSSLSHSGYLVEYKILLNDQAVKVVKESANAIQANIGDKVYLEIPESACVLVKD